MNRRILLPGLAALLAAVPLARGLVVLEQGKSQLFVRTAAEIAWDSNVFSNADEESDFYETARVGLDYERNAGLLTATAGVEWAYSHFERLHEESSAQPSAHASLARKRGRLTGKFDCGWRKANESDNFANQRTRFGEATGRLELQYPVNHRFSVKAETTYENRDYRDPTLYDRKVLSESLDVFHAYTSKLDLVAGYRIRWSDLRNSYDRVDHALLVGANGKILPRLDGSVRFGFQRRVVNDPSAGDLDAFTASIATWWAPRNWITVGIQVSKDFATTSTAESTDGLNISLESRLATVGQLSLTAGAGYSRYAFFDVATKTRSDDSVYLRLGAEYPLTKRLKCTASATWMRNSSTFAFADYDRRLLNLAVSARY
jgi:hypothetical protein